MILFAMKISQFLLEISRKYQWKRKNYQRKARKRKEEFAERILIVSVFQITLPGTDEAAQDKCIVTKFTLPACYQRNKKKERETNPSKQIHTHSPITLFLGVLVLYL